MLDDAFHYLRLRGLVGNHCTVQNSPSDQDIGLAAQQQLLTHLDQSSEDSYLSPSKPKLIVWSAKSEQVLNHLARDYQQHFINQAIALGERSSYLENLAYTLNTRRSVLEWNSFSIVDSINDLRQLELKLSTPQQRLAKPKVAYIFTGQGAQWAGMGNELSMFPVFSHSLIEAEECLREIGCPWFLRGMIFHFQ